MLGPSLVSAAPRVYEALLAGTNPMAVLDAELADPTARHSVAVVGMAPAATSFVLRGDALQLRIETPSGPVETFPELRRGWRGGAVTSMSGWRIRLKSTTEATHLGDRTQFAITEGAAPTSEVWFGEVAEFSLINTDAVTTFAKDQPSPDANGGTASATEMEPASPEPAAMTTADSSGNAETDDDTIPDAPSAVSRAINANAAPAPLGHPAAPAPAAGLGMPSVAAATVQHATPAAQPRAATPNTPAAAPTASAMPPAPQMPNPSTSYDADDATVHEPQPAASSNSMAAPSGRHALPAREWAPQLNSNQGHVVTLSSTVVVGRAPVVDRAPDPTHAQLMQLRSPQQEISRSHLVVTYEAGNVLVWDLGSANGTVVARGGSIPEPLQAMNAVTLARGDVIDLGDGAMLWLG